MRGAVRAAVAPGIDRIATGFERPCAAPLWGNLAVLSPNVPAAQCGTEQESSVRRPRRLVLSAAALGLALAASGCTYLSPVQTHEFYQAADGTNANFELDGVTQAGVRNAVLVFGQDGTATFTATVVNYSGEEIVVDLEGIAEGTTIFSSTVEVPVQSTVRLGPGEESQQTVPVTADGVMPGSVLDLNITVGEQSTTISLPTFEDNLSHYQSEAPAAG